MFAITTPAASSAVTLSEAKQHLRVDGNDEDTLITATVKAAQAFVENVTGRYLAVVVGDYKIDSLPCGQLKIPVAPVQSVDAITYLDADGQRITLDSGAYNALAHSNGANIKPAYGYDWPEIRSGEYDSVIVTITAGYGGADHLLPNDLKQAVLLILGHWYENRENVVIGSGLSVDELPMAAKSIMDMYRIYR